MPLTAAPLFTDIHAGPASGAAYWTNTSDGKRIRIAAWPTEGAKGTVIVFPGRTEYVEKYGHAAGEFAARGLATVAVDWRGQGLADRLLDNPLTGHVENFSDYQKDVSALMRAAREIGMPRPYFLVGHSMGGCIGLRAVMEGLAVQAAAFTGPMWGIRIAPHMRLPAWVLSNLMPRINQGHRIPPGTKMEPYVLIEPFEDNMLTTDPEMHSMMRDQLLAHPELSLGGPSYVWLREALSETKNLSVRAAPNMPTITYLGSNERIVHIPRIHARMQNWKGGKLEIIEGGEHEVLLETEAIRNPVFDGIANLFLGNTIL